MGDVEQSVIDNLQRHDVRRWNCSAVAGFLNLSQLFAVLVFIGLSALAVATLLVPREREPVPAEVSGSPTPLEFLQRTVSNVLVNGDFITRAADGEAYVQIRYNSPEAFAQLVKAYRSEVSPQYRIITAVLQQSDDGSNWTGVATADELNGELVFDLRKAGAHKFWKMTVVKSGDAPEVVFGQLSFVKNGNFIQSVPLDAVWLSLVPASILILVSFQISLSFGCVFSATAVPVALFVLLYSLGYADFHTITESDSILYLERVLYGTYSPFRNAGYPTILLAVHHTIGLDYIAWCQLGTAIACYMAGAFLLAVRFANKWIGSILVLAVLLRGTIVQFAPDIMTEALFSAGLGLFAASLGILAWRPDRRAVVAAAVGIVLATLAKTIGVVLVLPALLLVRFLPKGHRLPVSGVIVICGLATYALMAISAYTRTGVASPESAAGFSLIGHVGWMLDDASMPPSDLTRSMIGAVAPVVAQRPPDLTNIHSLATLDRYVDVTASEYNTILWQKLYPIAASQFGWIERVEMNSFFLRFGLSSIRAHPFSYLRHIMAHFYGMWRDLGRAPPLRVAAINLRNPVSYASDTLAVRSEIPASVLAPYPSEDIRNGEAMTQSNLPLMFKNFWNVSLIFDGWTVALGALALLLSILFLVPGRLAFLYRTEIMIALSMNAYFGAHVLLQVSLDRYASTAVLAAIFLAASFVFTSCYALESMPAVLVSTLLKGRAATTASDARRN